ncbi:MAG: hypothetical protein AVO34_11220 [Firmicutes bacterium ML8_F2]|nr:MAG: hypothetical protein AVO34_11220 [Firmicutes bacterium ML8_F2]
MQLLIVSIVILVIGILMTMTGRGGGNFYVLIMVLAGQAMHQAATSAQFILLITSLAGMIIFQKNKLVDWKLALLIDPPTDIMAFVGGYFSAYTSGIVLKLILAGFLVLAGFLMLVKVHDKPLKKQKFGYWQRNFQGHEYVVNLWLTIPLTALAGFVAGAVGISCGSFKVPLMILLCGVPMWVAIGTSSAMVAATAIMGFAGHAAQGHFEPDWAIPLAIVAVMGGVIGGKIAIKTNPHKLKNIFAYTTLLAALIMVFNAFLSK